MFLKKEIHLAVVAARYYRCGDSVCGQIRQEAFNPRKQRIGHRILKFAYPSENIGSHLGIRKILHDLLKGGSFYMQCVIVYAGRIDP